ncbi:hypothetical protein C8Q76DRAFT_695754 [Earliella scabrosa]|nr:hypothetical protein C8Q76DRAFT_695754 [Earliella scabrosa]
MTQVRHSSSIATANVPPNLGPHLAKCSHKGCIGGEWCTFIVVLLPRRHEVRLPEEVVEMIAREYDVPTLLAWRSTSSTHRIHAGDALMEMRDRVVAAYIAEDNVGWFLDVLAFHSAVITGEAALAFVLRDTTLLGDTFEVAVDRVHGSELQDDVQRWFGAINVTPIPSPGAAPPPPYQPSSQRFLLPSQKELIISTSHNESAITCLAHGLSTAFMNFLTRDAFGCAFPLLTLRRCAIVAPADVLQRHPEEATRLTHLQRVHGFRCDRHAVELVPPQFMFGLGAYNRADPHYPCLRHWFLCPEQARYFGDPGSLLGFFDCSPEKQDELSAEGQPPFGPAVMWRLRWNVGCARSCSLTNRTLKTFATGWLPIDHEPFTYWSGYVGLSIVHIAW